MLPEKPLRAVVFDLDGLMFNTEELYEFVGTELLRRRGKDFPDELIADVMGRPQREALARMIGWHGLTATVDELMIETAEVFAGILDDRLACMPGLEELLAALETAAIPKAIATGSNLEFTRRVLAKFSLEPRFQFVITSEEIRQGKPHPEIYLAAAQRFALAPAEILALEDSANGCRSAVAAGTYTVAVPCARDRRRQFDGVGFVADSLRDRRIYAALGLRNATD
jgi:pseudouridine 5'-phosphatase